MQQFQDKPLIDIIYILEFSDPFVCLPRIKILAQAFKAPLGLAEKEHSSRACLASQAQDAIELTWMGPLVQLCASLCRVAAAYN